jgi:hypothetical protein
MTFKFTSPWDSLLLLTSEYRGSIHLHPAPTHDYPKGWRLSVVVQEVSADARFCCGKLPLGVGLNQAAERVLDELRARLSAFTKLAQRVAEVSP